MATKIRKQNGREQDRDSDASCEAFDGHAATQSGTNRTKVWSDSKRTLRGGDFELTLVVDIQGHPFHRVFDERTSNATRNELLIQTNSRIRKSRRRHEMNAMRTMKSMIRNSLGNLIDLNGFRDNALDEGDDKQMTSEWLAVGDVDWRNKCRRNKK